jgi:hypothetical protein
VGIKGTKFETLGNRICGMFVEKILVVWLRKVDAYEILDINYVIGYLQNQTANNYYSHLNLIK